MTVVVSLHDVTPAHESAVRRLWSLCLQHGATPALLVVPDWHGSWPLDEYPGFVDWLLDRASEGADILLHGLRHDEVGTRRGIRDHLRALGRTDREGEFLGLDYAEAADRITCGRDCLTSVGLEPIGFVPPAWLAAPAVFEAAAQLGFRCAEDDTFVYLLETDTRLEAPACRWSTRTPLRAWGSALVARGRRLLQGGRPLIRLALHPTDLRSEVTVRSIQWALTMWSSDHELSTYGKMLEEAAA
jgi:predicted deacetylase